MDYLITGGLGYIASHTILYLANLTPKPRTIIIIDNLSNSHRLSLLSIQSLIPQANIVFTQASVEDENALHQIFSKYNINSVIHFAGLKSVSESIQDPIRYYTTNLTSTLSLLSACQRYNVKNLIFSSSATVYGSEQSPLYETTPTGNNISNPYGQTKFIIEQILQDFYRSYKMNIIILRYFNPVGSHPSGLLNENPQGIPNNLMPYIHKVATGDLPHLNIFGNDYNTKDGTAERDYIHVMDLANAHILALEYAKSQPHQSPIIDIFNIGTGNPSSVLQMVKTFEKVNDIEIPFVYQDRREGDQERVFADNSKAQKTLNFQPQYTLEDMCKLYKPSI